MGYGVPAAVAAKLVEPERIVVAFAGDGDFLMTGQELATAVQYEAADRRARGRQRHATGRSGCTRSGTTRAAVSGTDLVNPDFAALARAYGAFGERVERTADFPAALERALASGKPALLHLVVDPEAITPRQTLTEIREQALAKS